MKTQPAEKPLGFSLTCMAPFLGLAHCMLRKDKGHYRLGRDTTKHRELDMIPQ